MNRPLVRRRNPSSSGERVNMAGIWGFLDNAVDVIGDGVATIGSGWNRLVERGKQMRAQEIVPPRTEKVIVPQQEDRLDKLIRELRQRDLEESRLSKEQEQSMFDRFFATGQSTMNQKIQAGLADRALQLFPHMRRWE